MELANAISSASRAVSFGTAYYITDRIGPFQLPVVAFPDNDPERSVLSWPERGLELVVVLSAGLIGYLCGRRQRSRLSDRQGTDISRSNTNRSSPESIGPASIETITEEKLAFYVPRRRPKVALQCQLLFVRV